MQRMRFTRFGLMRRLALFRRVALPATTILMKVVLTPWGRGTLQQVAIASLSNNRPCDATEIGIKSEVWRRMVGAANFNGHPDPDTIEEFEQDGANISLGTVPNT